MKNDKAEIRKLRARIAHMRFYLSWIHNPAGNDICTPKEIAEMGLARTDKRFLRPRRRLPPTTGEKA